MKKIIYIQFLLSALVFSACVKEPDMAMPDPTADGQVRIELFTNAEEYQAPVTRNGSADENGVGLTPWIIVFEGTDDNAVFRQAAQAVSIGGRSYVTLAANANPCRLLIVANAPATFYNGSSEVVLDQANLNAFFGAHSVFGNAMDNFTAARLASPRQTTVPYASTTLPHPMLPMTAVYGLPSIAEGTTIGTAASKVLLARTVARVSVEARNISGFSLVSAAVAGVPRNGTFYRNSTTLRANTGNLTDYLTDSATDPTIGIAPAPLGTTTDGNPIYIYESRKEERASVIVRGSKNGTLYYYRLAFVDNAGAYIDILRNKSYKFTITDVPVGVGYASLADAMANPPANIRYTITVTDQTSAEIADNGIYFLGLSNSEFRILDNAAYSNVVAFTVSTNAQAADIGGFNSIAVTSGSGFTVSPSAINLAATPGDVVTTEVKVSVGAYSAASTSTITVRLGNIVRTVRLQRGPSITAVSLPQSVFLDVVSASVTSQGTGGAGWLSLSADKSGDTPGVQDLTLPAPAEVGICFRDNIAVTGGVVRTGGEVWFSRANNNGRAKIIIGQQVSNMTDQPGTLGIPSVTPGYYHYAGAFWRWDQSGERLIYQRNNGNYGGKWVAKVVSGDFIVLDDIPTQDPGVTYTTGESPADMSLPANDATYRVYGSKTSVSGTLAAVADSYIRFRIGLTGNLPGGEGAAPRYGVVVLAYANYTRYAYIFVRQGEAADYVMRPTDPINSGGMVSDTRPKAGKFSPYSLIDPQKAATGVIDRGRGYVFNDFPSKAGYFFQWASTRAWYPTGNPASWTALTIPAGYWAANPSWESCPPGYHRSSDGSTSSAVFINDPGLVADSELRQSLWPNPVSTSGVQFSTSNNPNVNNNSQWGYYADGWFDRRALSGTDLTTTGTGVDVAYIGRVFFNPASMGSLFIPAQGYRNSTGVLLPNVAGYTSNHWTSARSTSIVNYMGITTTYCSLSGNATNSIQATPIRCVAD